MRWFDVLGFSWRAVARYPMRSGLMLLAMGIGVASVVVLTALGEGARSYVTGQFASLGTNLLIVLPGRSETSGAAPGMLIGQTPRDLTLEDALALDRSRAVGRVAPIVVGSAPVNFSGLEREVPVLGSTAELLEIRHWTLGQGHFLPPGDPRNPAFVCVIGAKVRNELFGSQRALGAWLRIGDRRFRVIGVLATEGRSIGVDVQETVIVPVVAAQMLFNTPSMFRVLVEARSRELIPRARADVASILKARHQGEEDVTVITQDAVLSTFDRIFGALTLTLAGIAAISLTVAGVLIMNVMLVAVSQRTAEIGLLKALGAPTREVMYLFLAEALLLSACGAAAGLAVGWAGNWLLNRIFPTLDLGTPHWAVIAGVVVALVSGLVFGALPARRAARLDPVAALSRR